MIHSRSLAIYLTLILVLGACSANPHLRDSLQVSVDGNAELIQSQQSLLNLQSQQLEQVNANQLAMAETLEQMQTQLQKLQQAKANTQKPEVVKKKSETVSGRKAAKTAAPIEGKLVVGRNEWVWLDLVDQTFNARIDTGTRSSAINAKEIQPFERNGESWVRFQLANDPDNIAWEAPLVSYVKVRNASSEDLERRPVIKLTVRLGSLVEDTQFTLANREAMAYPVQLGRDFLRDIAVVDVAKKFTQPKPDAQTVSR